MHDWRDTLARIEEHGNCAKGDYDADDLRKLVDQRDRAVELLRRMRVVHERWLGDELSAEEAAAKYSVHVAQAERLLETIDGRDPEGP